MLVLALFAASCEEALDAAADGIDGQGNTVPSGQSASTIGAAGTIDDGAGDSDTVTNVLPTPEMPVVMADITRWAPHGNTTVDGRTITADASGPYPDATRTARVASDPAVAARAGERWVGAVVLSPGVSYRAELRFYDRNTILQTVTSAPLVISDGRSPSIVGGVAPAGTNGVRLRVFMDDVDYGDRTDVISASIGVVDTELPPSTGPAMTNWSPLGNTTIDGTSVVVDAAGPYADNTRTARAGTSPNSIAAAGDEFRGSIVMSAGVDFRAELRFFDGRRIVETVTSAPIITSDGVSASHIQAVAPQGTDGVILRVFMDDVAYGERHDILVADLDRVSGTTSPAPTTTVRPPATTAAPSPTTTVASSPTTTARPVATTTQAPVTTTAPPTTTAAPTTTAPPTTVPSNGGAVALTLNSSNTGVVGGQNAGVCSNNLTRLSGTVTIDNNWVNQNGRVFENFDISGKLVVTADNVTVRCGRVRGGSTYTVHNQARNIRFEWLEAYQDSNGKAILGGNYEIYRCDVSGGEDGIHINTGTVTITECYVHDQNFIGAAHADNVQATSGGRVNNVAIVRSKLINFYKAPNASFQINVADAWSIHDSYLWGGAYSILGDPGATGTVHNNFFGWDSSQFGAIGGVRTNRSGNVWWEWINPRTEGRYNCGTCATPSNHPGNGTPIG